MSDLRDTISSNSEISGDEMEENSSISSEEEELECEGKGYTCEPEYSKGKLIKLGIDVLEEKSDVSTDDSNDSNELDSSRCENLHWCICTHCCIMPTLIEAIDLFCYEKTDDY